MRLKSIVEQFACTELPDESVRQPKIKEVEEETPMFTSFKVDPEWPTALVAVHLGTAEKVPAEMVTVQVPDDTFPIAEIQDPS